MDGRGDVVHTHRRGTCRSKLNGEGNAIHSPADRHDSFGIVLLDDESGEECSDTLLEQTNRVKLAQTIRRRRFGRRNAKWRHRPHHLAVDPQRLATGGDQLHLLALPEETVERRGGFVEDMFTVVDYEERRTTSQLCDDGVGKSTSRLLSDAHAYGDLGPDLLAGRDIREIDVPDSV